MPPTVSTRRPERSSPTGTVVCGRSDTDKLSVTTSNIRILSQARRAGEVRRAVADPGCGETRNGRPCLYKVKVKVLP